MQLGFENPSPLISIPEDEELVRSGDCTVEIGDLPDSFILRSPTKTYPSRCSPRKKNAGFFRSKNSGDVGKIDDRVPDLQLPSSRNESAWSMSSPTESKSGDGAQHAPAIP